MRKGQNLLSAFRRRQEDANLSDCLSLGAKKKRSSSSPVSRRGSSPAGRRSPITVLEMSPPPRCSSAGDGVRRVLIPQAPSASSWVDGSSRVSPSTSQLYLDLGQKEFGTKVCEECGMAYAVGEPGDEALHSRYHAELSQPLQFRNVDPEWVVWKDKGSTAESEDSCIIRLQPSLLSASAKKKSLQLVRKIDEFLGFPPWPAADSPCGVQRFDVYCYISRKRTSEPYTVESVVVAEDQHLFSSPSVRSSPSSVTEGRTSPTISVTSDTSSKAGTPTKKLKQCRIDHMFMSPSSSAMSVDISSPVRVESTENAVAGRICPVGVSRMWTSQAKRRCGLATALLEAVRSSFVYGCTVARSNIAFAQLTQDGKKFASVYTGLAEPVQYA